MMRRRDYLLLLAGLLTVLLGGCAGNSEQTEMTIVTEAEREASEAETTNREITENRSESSTKQKILIAYFTWADNTVVEDQEAAVQSAMAHYEAMGDAALYGADAISSASVVVPGNTARLGEWIWQETGGDLFSIQVKDPYPSDYEECMDRASREDAENARPELVGSVEDFSNYDVIFLGFPNWWGSVPMPVLSFVEEYDFSGKTVVPFCAHGTGGLSATVRDLKAALPDSAAVLDSLGVYRADIMEAQPAVQDWLKKLGFVE